MASIPTSHEPHPTRLLTTDEASRWLMDRGIPRTRKTLEAGRVRGCSSTPPFRRVGRSVRYAEADLLSWIDSVLTEPLRSTSEAA